MAEKTEGLVYRGHPLRRVDNLIYYGSMADKYIIMMQVLDTEDVKDLKLAKRVSIQLQLTDATLRSRDRVVRSLLSYVLEDHSRRLRFLEKEYADRTQK